MSDFCLDFDEGILLQATEVGWYETDEDSIDEFILTNKNLIFMYEYKAGFFSKSESIVEKIPLNDIKVLNGKVQVSMVDHPDYGNVLQVLFVDGRRVFFDFWGSKKEIIKWINAINSAILGDEAPIIEENKKKKGLFSSKKKNNDIVGSYKANVNGNKFCSYCGVKLQADAKFCHGCGKMSGQEANAELSSRKMKTVSESVSKNDADRKVFRCPNCGSSLTNKMPLCHYCGARISSKQDVEILREFQNKLVELESQKLFRKDKAAIISLIKNYPVPDSIDCMTEFMIFASACIEETSSNDVALAWYAKMKQIYMKARMTFPKEPEFKEIEKMYLVQKEEYEWV